MILLDPAAVAQGANALQAAPSRPLPSRFAPWLRPWFPRKWLALVLVTGVAIRVVLLPITRGQDFQVWDLATRATLGGHDVFRHHPDYPGGPYAYLPFFLDVELPLQWLSQHLHLSFTVLGKLPMLAGDVACALLIDRIATRRGATERGSAVIAALFFLNPLLIYNSAYYGRFDSLTLASLLAAGLLLTNRDKSDSTIAWQAALLFGVAVALKTFPILALPGILVHVRRRRPWFLAIAAIPGMSVTLPYYHSLGPLIHDVVLYNLQRSSGYLSWLGFIDHGVLPAAAVSAIEIALPIFLILVAVSLRGATDLWTYVAVVFVTVLVCQKLVLEQYLIWPLPFLAVVLVRGPCLQRWAAGAAGVVLTGAGVVSNASFHPFGRSPAIVIELVAGVVVCFLGCVAVRAFCTNGQAGRRPRVS